MRSQRLFYDDAETRSFTANLVEVITSDGRTAAVLDSSYFYPTSGGQPHDLGTLNGVPIIDVTIRQSDDVLLHWLAAPLPPGDVKAEIDWPRRFDHMQQHTGQHILSQAFIQITGAQTESFHLSADSVTIDLDVTNVPTADIRRVEKLANDIVWQNRAVQVHYMSPAEARAQNVRKIPANVEGKLRLVEITDFDITACGGTHVSRTGAVGLIKILKLERIRGHVRVEFCCGRRAQEDYGLKNEILQDLTSLLTTAATELAPTVERLQQEVKDMKRQLRKQEAALLRLETDELLRHGAVQGPVRIISRVYTDRSPGQLRTMSNQLREHAGIVVLLGLAGEKSFLLFACSDDAPHPMNKVIQPALQALGGRGGGTAVTAQGGGPPATVAEVQQAIELAQQTIS